MLLSPSDATTHSCHHSRIGCHIKAIRTSQGR